MASTTLRIGVLGSGSGSNMQSVLDAARAGALDAEIRVVLSDVAEFAYKCTAFYDPKDEGGIRWNDPDVGIQWPIDKEEIMLSERDRGLPLLKGQALEKSV